MKHGYAAFLDKVRRAAYWLFAFAPPMYGLVALLLVVGFRSLFEASVSVSIFVAIGTTWVFRTLALYLRNYFTSRPIFQTHRQLDSIRSRFALWAVVIVIGVPVYIGLERSRISTGLSPIQQIHLFLCEAMPRITPGSDLCSAYAKTKLETHRERTSDSGSLLETNRANEEAERQEQAAEEAERQKLAAEEAERQRLAAEEAERQKLAAEEAERQRPAAEEAERQRLAAEEAERQRLAAEEAERQRLAAEEAERQRLEAEEAERQELAAEETVSDFEFQTELDRLGCVPGPVDGAWGRRSTAALARLARILNEPLGTDQRDAELLAVLKQTRDNACKELCKANETLTEQGCSGQVRKSAPKKQDCLKVWGTVSCAE